MANWDLSFSDQSLGKFLSAESLLKVLSKRTLLWSRPSRFNDPYDCQPRFRFPERSTDFQDGLRLEFEKLADGSILQFSIRSPLGKAMGLLSMWIQAGAISKEEAWETCFGLVDDIFADSAAFDKKYFGEVVTTLNDVKILCLTKAYSNILMWSHYANNHFGALLIFQPKSPDSFFSLASPIHYSTELPPTMDIEDMPRMLTGQISMTDDDQLKKAIERIVMTKATDWRYEQEFRIFGGAGFSPEAEVEFNSFHHDDLIAVVFGCKFSTSERSVIIECSRPLYPGTRYFETFLSAEGFSLELAEIS